MVQHIFLLFHSAHFSNSGRKEEIIKTTNPITKTEIVRREHPRHSFNRIPHTLEKVTFNDINIHHEKVRSTGESAKNPLPKLKPKN